MSAEKFPRYEVAGFWRRALAYFLDFSILMTLAFPVGLITGLVTAMAQRSSNEPNVRLESALEGVNLLVTLAIAVFYYGTCYKKRGTTLGKQILGLKVVTLPYGKRPGYKEVWKREILGRILSFFTLGLGYLMVVFRKDKRALHDLVSETWVLKKIE